MLLKKSVISSLLICLVSTCYMQAHTIYTEMLDCTQIRNYVTNLVDTLVSDGGSSENCIARREIIEHVYKRVTTAQSFSELVCYIPITRASSYVEKQTIDGIINYCSRKSGIMAYSRTCNIHIANRIQARIEQEMKNMYANADTLLSGTFAPFVGTALREKVYQLCNQFDTPYQRPAQPQPAVQQPVLYTEKECRVCMEPFSNTVIRMYVMPCGHDICTECARKHFVEYKHDACPACRQTVNRTDLEQKLSMNAKVYASPSCCICLNDFGSAGCTRLFLKPCGHDMCINCAHDYFIVRNNSQCPQCRQTVDISVIRQALPSAPSL